MAERKPISKKTRFEVFKRDRFTCQYCGRMSPDVILEVDHIKPVAEGGTNRITNLITSCRDCNRGKGKRKLSDDAEIKKQQNAMIDLADKREQMEMISKWVEELNSMRTDYTNNLVDYWESRTRRDVSVKDWNIMRDWVRQFPLQDLYDAVDIAIAQYISKNSGYTTHEAYYKIGGIAFNLGKQRKEAQHAKQNH